MITITQLQPGSEPTLIQDVGVGKGLEADGDCAFAGVLHGLLADVASSDGEGGKQLVLDMAERTIEMVTDQPDDDADLSAMMTMTVVVDGQAPQPTADGDNPIRVTDDVMVKQVASAKQVTADQVSAVPGEVYKVGADESVDTDSDAEGVSELPRYGEAKVTDGASDERIQESRVHIQLPARPVAAARDGDRRETDRDVEADTKVKVKQEVDARPQSSEKTNSTFEIKQRSGLRETVASNDRLQPATDRPQTTKLENVSMARVQSGSEQNKQLHVLQSNEPQPETVKPRPQLAESRHTRADVEYTAVDKATESGVDMPELKQVDAIVNEQPQSAPAISSEPDVLNVKVAEQITPMQHAERSVKPQSLPEHIVKVAHSAQVDGKAELRLQLDPPELGRVTIDISNEGGKLRAELTVASPEAGRLVADQIPRLKADLTAAGYTVEDIDVAVEDGRSDNQRSNEQFSHRSNNWYQKAAADVSNAARERLTMMRPDSSFEYIA